MRRRLDRDPEALTTLVRAQAVPVLSTMAGSALAALPMVATWPALPPLGFMMLLGWRLLRPELWPAWIALPLGLFDDLMTGQAIGTAMFLWTIALLLLDILDTRLLWRDYWMDWLVAACLILAAIWGAIILSGLGDTVQALVVALPQMVLSILSFPIVVRLCLRLDRWRLPG